jgi:hypothetical protein
MKAQPDADLRVLINILIVVKVDEVVMESLGKHDPDQRHQ